MAVSARLTAKEGRKFAFTVGLAFLVLGALSAWRGHYYPPRIFGIVGGALMIAGVAIPGKLTAVHRAWMAFGTAISKVTSPIVIGGAYFLVMGPIGLFMRAIGRNPLRRPERNGSFWIPSQSGGRSDLTAQF